MLIYSYRLEKYIKKHILPKILLVPEKYVFKGSFKRRMPYITDIDIINNVNPEITSENIYEEILKLLDRIEEDEDIILVYITCGTDDRFKLNEKSDQQQLEQIRELLDNEEKKQFDFISEKYYDNHDKKIFYINELIWEHYKIRWTPKEIRANKKILPDGIIAKFSETVSKNNCLFKYFVKIKTHWIGIDMVVNYLPADLQKIYREAEEYQLKLSNYAKDYYYMLFPLRSYFYLVDPHISKELETLIDKKFGLYKQLMVQINNYQTLYQTGNLNIQIAKEIVIHLIRDIKYLPRKLDSDIINKIQKVAENNQPHVKIEKWAMLLDLLLLEINNAVNELAKPYFFRYLEKLPNDMQKKYYYNWENVRDV